MVNQLSRYRYITMWPGHTNSYISNISSCKNQCGWKAFRCPMCRNQCTIWTWKFHYTRLSTWIIKDIRQWLPYNILSMNRYRIMKLDIARLVDYKSFYITWGIFKLQAKIWLISTIKHNTIPCGVCRFVILFLVFFLY